MQVSGVVLDCLPMTSKVFLGDMGDVTASMFLIRRAKAAYHRLDRMDMRTASRRLQPWEATLARRLELTQHGELVCIL